MKRPFGLWLVAAAVMLTAGLLAAWAAYLETDAVKSDTEHPPRRLPPDVIVRPPPDGAAAVRALIRRIDVGDPVHTEGVTVFFLSARDDWDSDLRTLDDALRSEVLRIEEKPQASVPEVFVDNTGRRPVLLVSGELLLGGRQNRIVKQDVLVPADSGRIAIPVYCGEKERWTDSKTGFSSAPAAAEPELRKGAALGRAQSEIWNGIDDAMKRSRVESATRDYRVVHDAPEVKRWTDDVVASFRRHIPRRTVGMVVATHRRILGADLFEDPDTFSALWEKLVRGYAMGAGIPLEGNRKIRMPEPGTDRRDARAFMDAVLEASFDSESTPGSGRLLSIRGTATGSALVWDGHVVHIALFQHGEVRPAPVPNPIIRRQIED